MRMSEEGFDIEHMGGWEDFSGALLDQHVQILEVWERTVRGLEMPEHASSGLIRLC